MVCVCLGKMPWAQLDGDQQLILCSSNWRLLRNKGEPMTGAGTAVLRLSNPRFIREQKYLLAGCRRSKCRYISLHRCSLACWTFAIFLFSFQISSKYTALYLTARIVFYFHSSGDIHPFLHAFPPLRLTSLRHPLSASDTTYVILFSVCLPI